MDDFVYQNNRIKFKALTGTVLNSEKRSHSDTYTSTSGGGGYIHQGTGYINAPKTTTRTVTTHTHEFWLAKEDGTEQCIKLINADIPLREGQRITMISASREGNDQSPWIQLVNHSANRFWNIQNEGEFVQKFIKRSITTHMGMIVFGPPVILMPVAMLLYSGAILFIPILWIVGGVRRSTETTKLKTQVKNHLDRIAQLAFKY